MRTSTIESNKEDKEIEAKLLFSYSTGKKEEESVLA